MSYVYWLQKQGPAHARALTLVDIGCRGGPPEWLRAWPGTLRGIGIDPDQEEIARLQADPRWPAFQFQAAWIGHPDFEKHLPEGFDRARWRSFNNSTWRRTSSSLAQQVRAEQVPPGDPGQQKAPPPTLSLAHVSEGLQPDLLKIDTDGHDLEVLESGPEVLKKTLAVSIEIQLQGPSHPKANTFSNIDHHLRHAGFELFDLRVHRHSRAALPAPFWGHGASPTFGGQTVWGDAFYARDIVATPWEIGDRIWTLLALFEMAGLADCATEVALAHKLPPAALQALRRSWWRDGARWAQHWLNHQPERLAPLIPASLKARLLRLPGHFLWKPWRV